MSVMRGILRKDSRSAIRKPGATTTRRAPQILALTILLPAAVYGPTAQAQETFRLLSEREIRARVVGKDITDGAHWVNYLRPDGALLSSESGSKWTGAWKIQNNKLCMSIPSMEGLSCNEVWMSGSNIRMRANKEQETFDAIVEKHRHADDKLHAD